MIEQINVKYRLDSDSAQVPEYQTIGSAGCDLVASKDMGVLDPEESLLVPTGLFLEIPEGYEAQIRPRSGLAFKHKITVLNAPATIDSDYRGDIKVLLINHSRSTRHTICKGDRIAQLVFAKVTRATFEMSQELSETKRGNGGFGSTGK